MFCLLLLLVYFLYNSFVVLKSSALVYIVAFDFNFVDRHGSPRIQRLCQGNGGLHLKLSGKHPRPVNHKTFFATDESHY